MLGVAVAALTLTAAASGKGTRFPLNVGDKYRVGNYSQLACVNNSIEAYCGFFGINRPNSVIPGTIVARIREDTVALSKRLLPGLGKPPSTAPFTDVWKVTLPTTLSQPFQPGPAVSTFTAKGTAQTGDSFRPVFGTLQSDLIVRVFDGQLNLSKFDYASGQVYPGTGEAVLTETDLQGVQYTGQTSQTVFRASEPPAAANERALIVLWRGVAKQVNGVNRFRRTPPYLAHSVVRLATDAQLVAKAFSYDDVVDVCSVGVPKLQKDVRVLVKLGPRLPPKFRRTFSSQVKKVQRSLNQLRGACA